MNKISVAICTYNGAKFVRQQLYSIINQTLKVNEIVVGDDGSADDTMSIIEEIKNEHTEIEWNIVINKPGLGCCANFDDTIKRCTGDIVFLSDQDDIWDSKKVETIVKWFVMNPQKDVVFSNASFMDDNGQPFTEKRLFDVLGINTHTLDVMEKGFYLEAFMQHNRATGATMAFRKSFVLLYNIDREAIIRKHQLHDQIIAMAAAAENKLGAIDIPLIKYRIYKEQNMGLASWIKQPSTFTDPYAPFHITEQIERLPQKAIERVKFCRKRFLYRTTFLCTGIFIHIFDFIRIYKAGWYDIFLYDIIQGLFHKYIRRDSKVFLDATE